LIAVSSGLAGQVCLEVHNKQLVVNRCTTGDDPKQQFAFIKWMWSGNGEDAVDVVG